MIPLVLVPPYNDLVDEFNALSERTHELAAILDMIQTETNNCIDRAILLPDFETVNIGTVPDEMPVP